jgi:hypothetical protein
MQEANESRLSKLASLIKDAQLKISHHTGEVRFRFRKIDNVWVQMLSGEPLGLSWVDAVYADACAIKAAKDQLEALQREERELRSNGQDVGKSLDSGDR